MQIGQVSSYYALKVLKTIAGLIYRVGGRIYAGFTSATTTAAATEQTLQTYSLPAKSLSNDGESVVIEASGTLAANGNNKTLKLTFGSIALSSGVITANAKDWDMRLEVIRTGDATQTYRGVICVDGTAQVVDDGTGTEDLTAAVTIAMKGTNGSASADITCTNMTVDLK